MAGRKKLQIDPDTLRRNVGMRVRYYRDQMSQRAFAEDCGITQAYLCRIERGEVDVSLSVLQKIAASQHETLAEFLHKIEAAKQDEFVYGSGTGHWPEDEDAADSDS